MTRDVIAVTIPDLSAFAKTLRSELQKKDDLPGHASMLTLIAKAAGYDNYQHLKTRKPATVVRSGDKQMDKARRVFDADGQMIRWPRQTAVQGLCLWPFWAALPARTDMSEGQVNDILNTGHTFGDHALLRRSLIDHKLVERTIDGKIYRRIEQAPSQQAITLIKDVGRS